MHNQEQGETLVELYDVLARCYPGVRLRGCISWQIRGDLPESWSSWTAAVFTPIILPHLVEVLEWSIRQSLNEVLSLDRAYDDRLSEEIRARSRAAGRELLLAKTPRGDRLAAKLQSAILTGAVAGHFATLFAVRAAGFAIPARSMVLAYLLQEASGISADLDPAQLLQEAAVEVNTFFLRSSDQRGFGFNA